MASLDKAKTIRKFKELEEKIASGSGEAAITELQSRVDDLEARISALEEPPV